MPDGDTTNKLPPDFVLPIPGKKRERQPTRKDTSERLKEPDVRGAGSGLFAAAEPLKRLKRLGEYELLREIGRGGMGAVFVGKKKGSEREVAVKVLKVDEEDDPEAVERFRREAHLTAQLTHPGIVAVQDFGQDRGHHYIVMKLVEGESLKALLRRGQLDPDAAVELALQMAEAVAHAHERGILHRDLKPQNILISTDGAVRVTDFGLARLLEPTSDRLTRTGQVLGTPAYMAPEQAGAGTATVDARTDVYALGVNLYEMLTGRPPFEGSNSLSVMMAVATQEPPRPSFHAPHLSPSLEAIVLRCMAKDPEQRFPTAEALVEALRSYQEGESVLVPAGLGRRGALQVLGGLAVLLLVVIATGLVLVIWDRQPSANPALKTAEKGKTRAPTRTTRSEKPLSKDERLRREIAREDADARMRKLDENITIGVLGTPDLRWAERIVRRAPHYGATYMRRALVLDRIDRRRDALADLATAERLGYRGFYLYALRGRWLYEQGRLREALPALSQAWKHAFQPHKEFMDPTLEHSALAAIHLRACVTLSRFKEGAAFGAGAFKRVLKPSWRAWVALARCQARVGEVVGALENCERGIRMTLRANHIPYVVKAEVFEVMGQLVDAEMALGRAYESKGKQPPGHPEVCVAQARLALKRNRLGTAIVKLREALGKWQRDTHYQPDMVPELFRREGRIQRRWEARREAKRRAQRLETLAFLCRLLVRDKERDRAEKAIEEAKADPTLKLKGDAAALARLKATLGK